MTSITPSPEMVERAKQSVLSEMSDRRLLNDVDDDLHDEIAAAIVQACLPALSCPDGFRLVPVEPTPEMLKAYSVGMKNYISTFDAAERQARWGSPKKGRGFELPEWEKAIARYRAMLAASPAPAPQPISQDQDRG